MGYIGVREILKKFDSNKQDMIKKFLVTNSYPSKPDSLIMVSQEFIDDWYNFYCKHLK